MANQAYMAIHNKANMRQLTKAQVAELEAVKLDVLWSLEVMDVVTPQKIEAGFRSEGRTPKTFKAFLKANKISTFDMSIDDYKKNVLGGYAEFVLLSDE